MRIKQSIEINRPVAQVWAVLADPCQDPRWCRKVKSVERVSEDSWRVIHKPVPLRPPMQLSLVIVDTDAPRRMTLREEDEAAVFDVEYSLEPAPAGTRFTPGERYSLEEAAPPPFVAESSEMSVDSSKRSDLCLSADPCRRWITLTSSWPQLSAAFPSTPAC